VDLALLGEVVRLRGIAQGWAKDVANYYHPKHASVTHKDEAENSLLRPTSDTHRLTAMIEFLVQKWPSTRRSQNCSNEHRTPARRRGDVRRLAIRPVGGHGRALDREAARQVVSGRYLSNYVHPKLAAISRANEPDHPLIISDEERAKAVLALLAERGIDLTTIARLR